MASYSISRKLNEFNGSSRDSSQFSSHRAQKNVLKFKAFLKTFPKDEQEVISEILHNYRLNRNVYYLAQALKAACDPTKRFILTPLLKLVIPASDRAAFDQFTCDEELLKQMAPHTYKKTLRNSSYESSPELRNSDGSMLCRSIERVKNKSHQISRSSSLSDLYESQQTNEEKIKRVPTKFGSTLRKKVNAVLNDKKSSKANRRPTENKKKPNIDTRSPMSSLEMSSTSRDNIATIHLVREDIRENDLGFIIGGGKELGTGIFISHVEAGSIADTAGLKQGDMIIKVNKTAFHSNLPHIEAATVLKSSKHLCIKVIPGGAKKLMNTAKSFTWIDASGGQPIAPPSDDETSSKLSGVRSYNSRSRMRLPAADERKINISIKPHQKFGLLIRGGSEYGIGIYVTGVDKGSVADHAGLKIGDQILEVNGFRFEGISHIEAVEVIKSSQMLILTVKYTGKIPQEIYRSRRGRNEVPILKKTLHSNQRSSSLPRNGLGSNLVSDLEMKLFKCENKAWIVGRENLLDNVCKYSSGDLEVEELTHYLNSISTTDHDIFKIIPLIRDLIRSRDVNKFDSLTSDHSKDIINEDQSNSIEEETPSLDPPITNSPIVIPPAPPISHHTELLSKITTKKKKIPSPLKPKRKTNIKNRTDYSVSTQPQSQLVINENVNEPSEEESDLSNPLSIPAKFFPPESSESSQESSPRLFSSNGSASNKPNGTSVSFDKNFKPSQLLSPKRKSGISIGRFTKAVNNKKSLESIQFTPNSSSSPKSEKKESLDESPSSRTSSSASSLPPVKDTSNDPECWTSTPPTISFHSSKSSSTSTNKKNLNVRIQDEVEQKSDFDERSSSNHSKYSPETSMEKPSSDLCKDDESLTCENDDIELQKMVIFRVANNLGLTIEGGAGTEQPLPRIRAIQEGSCSHKCTRLQVGHIVHAVNDKPLQGLSHNAAVASIARAFKSPNRDSLVLTVSGPHNS